MIAFFPRASVGKLSPIRYWSRFREIYQPNTNLLVVINHEYTTTYYLKEIK